LEPYRQRYPEIFALAERLVGRLHSYGQHPAGMIISTEGPLLDRLPLRNGDDGLMISQFEFDDLDSMGLIKFDILTIRTLDTLQATVDGARAHFGIEVDVYDFAEEYDDPMVWDEIAQGHTLGMFQIETAAGTKLVRRFRPQSVLELSDIGALVRPGPMRSGLTEAYLRRRAGEEPVHYAHPGRDDLPGAGHAGVHDLGGLRQHRGGRRPQDPRQEEGGPGRRGRAPVRGRLRGARHGQGRRDGAVGPDGRVR